MSNPVRQCLGRVLTDAIAEPALSAALDRTAMSELPTEPEALCDFLFGAFQDVMAERFGAKPTRLALREIVRALADQLPKNASDRLSDPRPTTGGATTNTTVSDSDAKSAAAGSTQDLNPFERSVFEEDTRKVTKAPLTSILFVSSDELAAERLTHAFRPIPVETADSMEAIQPALIRDVDDDLVVIIDVTSRAAKRLKLAAWKEVLGPSRSVVVWSDRWTTNALVGGDRSGKWSECSREMEPEDLALWVMAFRLV